MDQYISPADREKGTALAQQYALRASPSEPSRSTIGGTGRPPSRVADTPRPSKLPASSLPARVPVPTREPVLKPAPVKAIPVKAAAKATATRPEPARANGNWRVQLGAFRDQGNAETLWNRIRGKLRGAQPFYAKANGVTRLQAGGFASKADAARACSAAGVPCVVVAP
jgi:cell division septation protein DedD